jgi:uncharacterized protein (DUF1330 family)
MHSVEPSHDRFRAFQVGAENTGPVVMINLLRYRPQAQYSEDFDATPCTGREAYQRYSAAAVRQIDAVAGRVIFWGSVQATVIAPDGEEWDDAFMVEYPNRAAMLKMLSTPDYLAVVPHRTAALLDSRLIATQPRVSALGLIE